MVVDVLKRVALEGKGLVCGHTDADGVTSAVICAKGLEALGGGGQKIMFVEKVGSYFERICDEAKDCCFVVLLDLGDAACLADKLSEVTGKTVIVIDHHETPADVVPKRAAFFNTVALGLSSRDGSCSAATYHLIKQAAGGDVQPLLAKMAIVGAVGDRQEFTGLNSQPVDDIQRAGRGFVVSIPSVFGLSGGIKKAFCDYLRQQGRGHEIPVLEDLLARYGIGEGAAVTDIPLERFSRFVLGFKTAFRIPASELRKTVIFTDEDQRTPFGNADEFAALLNNIVRLGKLEETTDLLVRICCGDRSAGTVEKAIAISNAGKKVLGEALSMIFSGKIPISQEFRYVQYLTLGAIFGRAAPLKLASTIATMLATGADDLEGRLNISPSKYIMVFSTLDGERSKVSIRVPPKAESRIIRGTFPPASSIVRKLIPEYFEQGGGHDTACGATLRTDRIYDAVRAFNEAVSEAVRGRIILEASARAGVLVARKQVDGTYCSEIYPKKSQIYNPLENMYLFVKVSPIAGAGTEEIMRCVRSVYIYMKQVRGGARAVYRAENIFKDDMCVYYYTGELKMPEHFSGAVSLIPILEVAGADDVITADTTIQIMDRAKFEKTLMRFGLLGCILYKIVQENQGRRLNYVVRYYAYTSPARMIHGTPSERDLKVKKVTAESPPCVPEHFIKGALGCELAKAARDYSIPQRDVDEALNKASAGLQNILREMCFFNLLNEPFRGTVVAGGNTYEMEPLYRTAGEHNIQIGELIRKVVAGTEP